MTKKWLLSIDFGQTDPDALRMLANLPRSEVRLASGTEVLSRNLVPRLCFHPKTYLFGMRDQRPRALPAGFFVTSANLTVGGLYTNVEHGMSTVIEKPLIKADRITIEGLERLRVWWIHAWRQATLLTEDVLRDYEELRHQRDGLQDIQDLDELSDQLGTERPTEAPIDQSAAWATARYFWIEVGELYKNRGPDAAGNQLDCTRGTRVYFGFPPVSLPKNTVLGYVQIQYGNGVPQRRSVRFADNSMDKVNLPVPGGYHGPPSYDHMVLRFERVHPRVFHLTAGTRKHYLEWLRQSDKQKMLYTMGGGRRYGFFS